MEGKIKAINQFEQIDFEKDFYGRQTYMQALSTMIELYPNHTIEITFKSKM